MKKPFSNQAKWIEVPDKLGMDVPYLKAIPLRPIGDNAIQYQIQTNKGPTKIQIPNQKTYLMSNGQLYDDMCDMDILNEPEVLNNLVQRYKNDKICTFIGPTLVVVNPFRVIPEYFSNEVMMAMRNKIIEGNASKQKPHIYLIAGNAYTAMISQRKKQAIVISGESGAGKTESTKYCMRLLTSLSHKQAHPIQAKILACNPILQAFGNSKTTRNDNSSRFGKYVQIYFGADNTIAGANIYSYLLEKSRVVAAAQRQRNFHIFYALVASQTITSKSFQDYKYLERSKCYEAAGINDKEYFKQITESMNNIGFNQKDQTKIWQLMSAILQLGNVQFDDGVHKEDPNKPCKITQASSQQMKKVCNFLGVTEPDLEKILLYEKKVFLKEVTFSPYNKQKCVANANTLSKAIYNSTFEFILYKIQKSLRPAQFQTSNSKYLSINILDIFGFENFETNSFEQFCINFTNQKLLKLYNQYVFQREMKILQQDGLESHISSIKAPTNQVIIETMSGKISLFSIINDNTIPIQFKDSDIINGFQKIPKSACLEFDKMNKNKFIIIHSQCSVKYDIDGFKQKNQDKVLPQIADIVNNLFQNQNKDQVGKTLLSKFSKQIDDLMSQLTSSSAHFIRCIKPNEKKLPRCSQEKYMLTQVRYLGVFETIQIRKKTFPSRWLYDEFVQRFQSLFPITQGNSKLKTQKILSQLTKDSKQYLLGNQRVYMNSEIQAKLLKKLHQGMKKKLQSGKKIWRFYKKYRFRKQIKSNLKILVSRIMCWKNIAARLQIQIKKKKFQKIKDYARQKKQESKPKLQKQKQEKTKIIQQKKIQQQQVKQIKLKSGKNISVNAESNQNEKTNNQLNETRYVSEGPAYQRNIEKQVQQQHSFDIHQSFINQKTILEGNNSQIAFQGTLTVPFFNPKQITQSFKRLKLILADKFKSQFNQGGEDHLSPPSEDSKYNLEDTPHQLLIKITQFDTKTFFKRVLRRRTNVFGMLKDEHDILVAKTTQLNKSLTLIDPADQKDAFRIFKQILRAGQQAKLDSVFNQIQRIMIICKAASPQLVNEILLQLIKQTNSSNQLCSIRIIQTLVVFLHIFEPDKDFLLASLNFLYKKISENSFSQRQSEYFRYAYKKMIRKFLYKSQIGFMPIKYQIMALMCKRMISVPIYLTVGSSFHVKVDSYESLADIKIRVMYQLGIDHKRLNPDYFGFFELTNFVAGISEEKPLNERINVWDLVSYWQRSSERYMDHSQNPPTFYLVLKIKYIFQCHLEDEEATQLMFGQTFFDYFMNKIFLPLKKVAILAACIKKLKFPNSEVQDYRGCYPQWAIDKYSDKQLTKQMCDAFMALSSLAQQYKSVSEQQFIKFRFLKAAQQAPLCMSFVIPSDEDIKMHFRFKMIYLTRDYQVVKEIPIKTITRYAQQGDYFVFSVRDDPESKMIHTEHASICTKYMAKLQQLVTKKATSIKNENNNILKNL